VLQRRGVPSSLEDTRGGAFPAKRRARSKELLAHQPVEDTRRGGNLQRRGVPSSLEDTGGGGVFAEEGRACSKELLAHQPVQPHGHGLQ